LVFQGGVPVNARSCKHLISLLGEKYEAARVKFKNPDGPPLKGSKKPASKAKAKAKAPAKRKRRGGEDDDGADDDVIKSPKKARTAATGTSAKGTANVEDEDEDGGVDDDDGGDDEPVADSKKIPELLLANKWDIETGPDPTGWWISEKLDGVRLVMILNNPLLL
jgi:DNA ligase-1